MLRICNTQTLFVINPIQVGGAGPESRYVLPMKLACLLGMHRPSISSIAKKRGGLTGLCEGCARPLERQDSGRWIASEALYERRDRAA
jgi:hypothetical protein